MMLGAVLWDMDPGAVAARPTVLQEEWFGYDGVQSASEEPPASHSTAVWYDGTLQSSAKSSSSVGVRWPGLVIGDVYVDRCWTSGNWILAAVPLGLEGKGCGPTGVAVPGVWWPFTWPPLGVSLPSTELILPCISSRFWRSCNAYRFESRCERSVAPNPLLPPWGCRWKSLELRRDRRPGVLAPLSRGVSRCGAGTWRHSVS